MVRFDTNLVIFIRATGLQSGQKDKFYDLVTVERLRYDTGRYNDLSPPKMCLFSQPRSIIMVMVNPFRCERSIVDTAVTGR